MTISSISDTGAAFPSPAQTGIPKVVQEGLAVSQALVGVVKNQLDFAANITNEIVQSIPQAQSFSVYG